VYEFGDLAFAARRLSSALWEQTMGRYLALPPDGVLILPDPRQPGFDLPTSILVNPGSICLNPGSICPPDPRQPGFDLPTSVNPGSICLNPGSICAGPLLILVNPGSICAASPICPDALGRRG
jgi:hypothetical protein